MNSLPLINVMVTFRRLFHTFAKLRRRLSGSLLKTRSGRGKRGRIFLYGKCDLSLRQKKAVSPRNGAHTQRSLFLMINLKSELELKAKTKACKCQAKRCEAFRGDDGMMGKRQRKRADKVSREAFPKSMHLLFVCLAGNTALQIPLT